MKYFTIAELSKTNTGIKNVPGVQETENLKRLIEKVLDPAREEFGLPIFVSSGYRSPEVNQAAQGAKNSQHLTGCAADIKCDDNRALFRILQDMEFDQLIYEFGDENQPAWIHVSYRENNNRQQVLRAVKSKGKTTYLNIN